MEEAIEMFNRSMSDEVRKLDWKYKQAEQNYYDAKRSGDQKRMEACEKSKITNDVAKAAIEWAVMVMRWHKEEVELSKKLLNA